ncbi:MAG TPA: sugar-binding protein [Tepidisphaeraceae bacterium]|jgi:ribose transport system substrate-binding protein
MAVAVGLAAMTNLGCDRSGSGGGAGGGGKVYKLAFVTNNASEFWKIASNGVHKYEREGKVQVDIKMPPNGKTEEQNQILENLVSQGYDAIAVSVIAPKDQVAVLNRTADKARLITFDSDASESKRLLYVGTINYEAGKRLGEQIIKLLPNGGKMAVFVGMFSADNAAQRLRGIEDAIKGHNIEIVEKREDQTDRAKARSNVEDILNARPDVNLICGLWSYNGPAIADALEGSGKKGKVLAAVFDEEAGTLKGINNGTINCSVVQHPYDMGYQSAKWMHELASDFDKAKTKIPPDKIVNTGVEIIQKDNVADFEKRLAEWKK